MAIICRRISDSQALKAQKRPHIDLRVFYEADDDEFRPTKKGLTLSPELLPELEQAVHKLKEAVEA